MAATLLLPGAARDLATARQAIPEALAELARFLRANKLSIVATEQGFEQMQEASAPKPAFAAPSICWPRRSDGRPVVIDLKWQRTDKYRRKEIADGVAIQLAVYAKTCRRCETRTSRLAISCCGRSDSSPARRVSMARSWPSRGTTPRETWRKIETSWRAT